MDPHLNSLRPEVLSQTLAKPVNTDPDARASNPNLQGRVAYSLPVYLEHTRVQMRDMKKRMAAIDNKKDPTWKKLYKRATELQ